MNYYVCYQIGVRINNSMEKYNLSKKFADNIIFEDIHNEIS